MTTRTPFFSALYMYVPKVDSNPEVFRTPGQNGLNPCVIGSLDRTRLLFIAVVVVVVEDLSR